MADSQINIIINTMKKGMGDKDTKSALKSIGSEFTKLTGISLGWAGAVSAGVAVGKKLIDFTKDAITSTSGYIDQVERLRNLTGEAATQESRLIQVSDDLFISYESLEKGLIAANKNGIDTSIEGLGKLADQFLALEPGQERSKFLTDNLGKAGNDWYKILLLGSEGLKEKMAAVDASLVIDEKAIQANIAYKKSQDDVNDSLSALKITVGTRAMPAISDFTNGLNYLLTITEKYLFFNSMNTGAVNSFVDQISKSGKDWERYMMVVEAALEQQGYFIDSNGNLGRVIGNQSRIIQKDYVTSLKTAYDGVKDLASGEDDATDSTEELNAALLIEADKLAAVKAGVSGELKSALDAYQNTMVTLNGTVEENNQKQSAAEAQLKKTTAQFIYQQIAAKLDSDSSLELARSMGLIDEQSYAVSKSTLDAIAKFDADKNGKIEGTEANQEFYNSMQLIYDQQLLTLGLQDKTFKYTIQTYYQTFGNPGALNYNPDTGQLDGSGGSEGGGGSDSKHNGEAHNNEVNGYYDNSGKWHWWAAGGVAYAGQSGFTGEKGIEYFATASDGYVIPHDDLVQIGKMFGSQKSESGAPVIINNNFVINGATDANEVADDVLAKIERSYRIQSGGRK